MFRHRTIAGQTAFYSQRILHRASYLPSRKRATLHGCYGDLQGSKDEEHAAIVAGERARNVLQVGNTFAINDDMNERANKFYAHP